MTRSGLIGFPVVLLALAAVAVYQEPLGVSLFHLTFLATMFFWVAQATSWNILSGYSGYFSFGQGAFVGVGVYTTAVLTSKHDWNFYLTLPVAAVLSMLLALGIGALAFRLGEFRGATFALLTLAVPFILASVARLSSRIDGGQGVAVPVPDMPADLGFQQLLYLVMLAIAGVAVAAAYAIQHTRFGAALAAIRDNEDVAEGLGVATFRWKMLAIAVTGAIGGVAGSAWALQFGFVQVEVIFGLTVPLFVIVMSVLGGRTYWLGPVIGAAVIVLLQDRLAGGGFESWRLIVFGGLLAVMVIFAPEGLWGNLRVRPRACGLTAAGALLVLFVTGIGGDLLDRVALAMLATVVVAFWPRRLVPPRLRGTSRVPTMPDSVAPASVASGVTVSPRGDVPERFDVPVAVECRDLARYFGGVRALDGVDLQIRQGELVGLIGPNGSGKTTLVNLLSGAVRPTRGSIHVAGRDVTRLTPHAISHVGVSRTYQIPRPFESMTLQDNVAMSMLFGRGSRTGARARAIEYLEFVGLEQHAAARPADINLHQRQLLEMARALATDPVVLLLDESLAGLNPAEIDSAVEVVRRIHASGVTIVVVEHLLRVVNQLAERLIVLNRGSVLAHGDVQTVMRDPTVVDVYLGRSGRTERASDGGGEHA